MFGVCGGGALEYVRLRFPIEGDIAIAAYSVTCLFLGVVNPISCLMTPFPYNIEGDDFLF